MKNCVDDFLDSMEAQELFEYLKLLPKKEHIENFIKYELTNLYFKERKNLT
ncbi:hypothetical protein [Helicobacter canadensis]|uniref:hypothetical protein n=1 Tax=Helicobacter canadensis TaxID=123841 RepID=UPI0015F03BE8|nr:hypothetical protein [Helicobacter canadensis]